ncbi:MAG: aldo/keto reductase, partial [Verrucomicrobia bacterium RIFCSPLOWO2_12_FULL_64_8]
MNYRPLGRTGLNVSVLSLGGSSLGGAFRATDDQESIRTVHAALDLGINFIDVSPYYGKTRAETVLGRALRGVPRDRYLLATKVGQYDDGVFDFSAARVTHSLDESCARLGVDYVDLLHCHDIEFADLGQIVDETLPALVRLREQGRIGHIGITGLPLKIFPAVLERTAPGAVEAILSFCHYELNDNSLTGLLPLCRARGVGVINASPTGMGLLTDRGAPAWHPAPPAIVQGCRRAVEFCQAKGVDIVQLAVQFSVAHPQIAPTLIGTANPENIRWNVAWAEAEPDFALIGRVLEVLRPIHNHNFTRGRPE